MKLLYSIGLIVMLAGCASKPVPVVMPFPDVPADLKVACPDLDMIPDNTDKLSDVVDTVANNYSKYHDCRSKVSDWNSWYETQKQISDKVK